MKKFLSLISIVIVGLSTLVFSVHAQGIKNAKDNLDKAATPAGVTDQADLGTVVGRIINAALTLVGVIFLILMVYAGYLWMTARGEESQIEKAKAIIIGTVIGLVIVVSAYAITIFVTGQFAAS